MKRNEIFIQISIITAVVLTGTSIYFFSSSVNSNISEAAKDKELNLEQTYPQRFLLDRSSIKHTIKDKKLILEGCVFNRAETVSYKSIVLKIDLYNEDSKLLDKQSFVINKSITPNQTIDYKTTITSFEKVEFAAVTILKADIMKKNVN